MSTRQAGAQLANNTSNLSLQQQAAAGSRQQQRLAQTARSALKDNVAVTYGPVAHSNQTFMEMRRCHRHFFFKP